MSLSVAMPPYAVVVPNTTAHTTGTFVSSSTVTESGARSTNFGPLARISDNGCTAGLCASAGAAAKASAAAAKMVNHLLMGIGGPQNVDFASRHAKVTP